MVGRREPTMKLRDIFSRYPDQEACLEHLERVRWATGAHCPKCGSQHVGRKTDGDRVGRWNCHACHASFNVLSGTIFEKTQIALQDWFMAIGIMINAKKSVSSHQLARDLDINQKSAWYMQQRIRSQMATEQGSDLLQGIVEADETYVGGKPRRRGGGGGSRPRGRAASRKTPVIGAVERGGSVVAKVADDLSGRGVLRFIRENVDPYGSVLITDEFRSYRAVRETIDHTTINHGQRQYVDGYAHTNTIEGFWALLKRAWYGTHHRYAVRFLPLYVAEAAWKYNHRRDESGFGSFLAGCVA